MYLFYANWLCSWFDNLPARDQSMHPLRYPLSRSCLKKKAFRIRWALFACLVLLCLNTNLNHKPVAAALHDCHISPPRAPLHCLRQRQILRSWLWYTSALFVSEPLAWSAAEINPESWWLDGGMCVCYGSSSVCHGDSYTTLFHQISFAALHDLCPNTGKRLN